MCSSLFCLSRARERGEEKTERRPGAQRKSVSFPPTTTIGAAATAAPSPSTLVCRVRPSPWCSLFRAPRVLSIWNASIAPRVPSMGTPLSLSKRLVPSRRLSKRGNVVPRLEGDDQPPIKKSRARLSFAEPVVLPRPALLSIFFRSKSEERCRLSR